MVERFTINSESEALSATNFSRQYNENARRAEEEAPPVITSKSHKGTSKVEFKDGKMFQTEGGGVRSVGIRMPDREHVLVDGVRTSRAMAETMGYAFDEIDGEVTVDGGVNESGEAVEGPVEVTDESTISFETTDPEQVADMITEVISDDASDAILEAMVDAGDSDTPTAVVMAFAKEAGLSPELSKESLITVRDALQMQANDVIMDMGVANPGDLYMQMSPSLRREVAIQYARGNDGPLNKAVKLYLHGSL